LVGHKNSMIYIVKPLVCDEKYRLLATLILKIRLIRRWVLCRKALIVLFAI